MNLNECWTMQGLTRTEPEGKAALVKVSCSGKITVRSVCGMVDEVRKKHSSFWDVLGEWGGGMDVGKYDTGGQGQGLYVVERGDEKWYPDMVCGWILYEKNCTRCVWCGMVSRV